MKQQPNDIFKGNAFEPEITLQEKDDETGKWIPATGLADLTLHISATDAGDPIHASLSGAATERSEKLGTYYTKISGANITQRVFPTADETEFFVVGKNAAGDVIVSSSRRAWNVRKI
jgi:hypothetical protein